MKKLIWEESELLGRPNAQRKYPFFMQVQDLETESTFYDENL